MIANGIGVLVKVGLGVRVGVGVGVSVGSGVSVGVGVDVGVGVRVGVGVKVGVGVGVGVDVDVGVGVAVGVGVGCTQRLQPVAVDDTRMMRQVIPSKEKSRRFVFIVLSSTSYSRSPERHVVQSGLDIEAFRRSYRTPSNWMSSR
jgi:hypothetical protein